MDSPFRLKNRALWREEDSIVRVTGWNEICERRKREKPREKPTQNMFRAPRNSHGVT